MNSLDRWIVEFGRRRASARQVVEVLNGEGQAVGVVRAVGVVGRKLRRAVVDNFNIFRVRNGNEDAGDAGLRAASSHPSP